MNYETIPAQIRCTKCRTIQDASHKFCKECGINFIPNGITVRPSPFPQEGTKLDRDLEKWIDIEKRYFIPPVTCDQTKVPLISRAVEQDNIVLCASTEQPSACISTSPEASREMARRFHESCGCKSHISDVFSKVKFEDIIPKD